MPSLIFPTAYSGISSYAFNQIACITCQNTYLQTFLSFIIILITTLLLNKIAVDGGLTTKTSTLIALLYIMLTSSILSNAHNNPVIYINLIAVFILANMMSLSYTKNTIPAIFNASLLLGIASLFYSQLVFLILFIWLAIIIHRLVAWRNFAVTIIGITVPYIFALTWFFFTNSLLEDSYQLFYSLHINIAPVFFTNPIDVSISVIMVGLIIISTFGVLGNLNEKNINLRRNITIIIYYGIIMILILVLFSKSTISSLLLCIPAAMILGYWLSGIKNTKWYNIALVSSLILIILNQYINFFIDA